MLANQFRDFFEATVFKIRNSFLGTDTTCKTVGDENPSITESECLCFFLVVTTSDLKSIVTKMPPKSCLLDPMPTRFVKNCLLYLLPVITNIVNSSIKSNSVPLECKKAHVMPLLKKPGFDPDNLANYRLVTNLSFLSKVLEKETDAQLGKYIESKSLQSRFQSAYRAKHSTETALLKVQSDILSALDNERACVLVLLDLSSAFDVIDHGILVRRL